MDNNSLSHTRWKYQYHIVLITKYRNFERQKHIKDLYKHPEL